MQTEPGDIDIAVGFQRKKLLGYAASLLGEIDRSLTRCDLKIYLSECDRAVVVHVHRSPFKTPNLLIIGSRLLVKRFVFMVMIAKRNARVLFASS